MRRLSLKAQWRAYDADTSFLVRRLRMSEILDFVKDGPLEQVMSGKVSPDDTEVFDVGADDALKMALDVIEFAVTDWTVVDEDDQPLALTRAHADMLISDEPDLMGWLVESVLFAAAEEAAKEEAEKNV